MFNLVAMAGSAALFPSRRKSLIAPQFDFLMRRGMMTAIVLWCALTLQFVGKPNIRAYRYQQSTSAQGTQPSTSQNNEAATTQTKNAENSMPPWYATPEWWLVGVGILTLLGIYYQARKTAQATTAMRDNTELQKIGMRQWVVSGHWTQNPRYDNGQLSEIAIGIPIANETNYPLRLDSVVAELNGVEQIKPVKSLIAPGGDDIHWVRFKLRLEGPDLIEYNRNNLFLVVECAVTFVDVFNEPQTMTFNRFYRCGPGEFEQIDKYTKGQNPT